MIVWRKFEDVDVNKKAMDVHWITMAVAGEVY